MAVICSFLCSNSLAHQIRFFENPCFTPIGKYRYEICADLRMSVNDTIIVIPKGFQTDFASIPKVLWSFVSPMDDQLMLPALLHDFLYRSEFYSRKESDCIFYDALRYQYVSIWKATLMYYTVRLAGWRYYGSHP